MQFKLIFGLGNNDPEYRNTYHNVGFMFIDHLQSAPVHPHPNLKMIKNKGFMNEAGRYVREALKKNNIQPVNLLVVHDDSDINIGNFKIAFNRSSAGHKGVENITQTLKTKNFWRLRIGIRPPEEKVRQKAEKFVLKKIAAADQKILEEVFRKAALKIES